MREREREREREHATWATVLSAVRKWAHGNFCGDTDTEDIVGETMMRMIAQFGPSPSQPIPMLVAWSKTTGVRVFVDSLRTKARRRTVLHPDLDQSPGASTADPLRAGGQRLRTMVATALRKPMASKQRQMLLLMAEGMTDNESLAKQLSLSTRTIERYRANLLHMFD